MKSLQQLGFLLLVAALSAGCSSIRIGDWGSECRSLPPCQQESVEDELRAESGTDFDWNPYANILVTKIGSNWKIPEYAHLGEKAEVVVRFLIQADGTLGCLEVVEPSGKPPLRDACVNAICNSAPFPPLPEDRGNQDPEKVTLTFYYNQPSLGPGEIELGDGKAYRFSPHSARKD